MSQLFSLLALINSPVLAYADFQKQFVLEVDASQGGLRAVLSQEVEGKLRPVAYASRSLRPMEKTWKTTAPLNKSFWPLNGQ